jgi:hypothetical protein
MTTGQKSTKIARLSAEAIGSVSANDINGDTTATAYRNASERFAGTITVMA